MRPSRYHPTVYLDQVEGTYSAVTVHLACGPCGIDALRGAASTSTCSGRLESSEDPQGERTHGTHGTDLRRTWENMQRATHHLPVEVSSTDRANGTEVRTSLQDSIR